ncbi:3-hydroxyisobutyrate dehydrogenase, mitochondrial-like isoform X2 [Gigantopelta aegis]|uniref:3-hydroxyisobutyrate dehydrogenase, mitochondrial-like isoform X2 n=1 Tax=Gigantopelta aegis TaxID=1735272 RepID=UPI001B88B04E|nr:3-hydroxyisobutyrate dehydrogenase, mitochondrial-like isoform X2 [Gigantopelta aegis]
MASSGERGRFSTASRWADQPMVGFIGVGNMGGHMARNLLKKGYPLMVYDVSQQHMDTLKKDGAVLASSPAEVADHVTRIVTMLPESAHVQEVYTGKNGLFSKVKKQTLFIDSSTIDPAVSQAMAEEATEHGAMYVDAPVSGGVNAARDAVLTFMVGGTDKAFTDAKLLLDWMGKNIVHCGPVGTGQAAKICNNMLLGISMIGTSEAMNLGIKLGLDSKMLAKIFSMGSGRCWSSEVYNPVPGVIEGIPSSNDYKGGFGTALMTKDLKLAQNAAIATQSSTPMGSLAHQIYRMMTNQGFGEKDFSSAYQFIKAKL